MLFFCLCVCEKERIYFNSRCFCMKAFAQDIIVNLKCKCLSQTSRSKIVIQIFPESNWELLWPFSSPVRSDKCYICTKKTLKKKKKKNLVRNMPAGFTCLFDTIWPPPLLPFIFICSHSCPCCCVEFWLWSSWSFEQWWVDKWYYSGCWCA